MARKFDLGKGPFIRIVDEKTNSTFRMMLDVLIALVPIIIFGWIQNGLLPFIKHNITFWAFVKPIANVLTGAFASIVFEGLYFRLFKKVKGFKNVLKETTMSFAVLPGIFLALVLPVTAPLWMIVLGCFIANIVFKMLFGGFGHNIFNPALIAYVFLTLAFAGSLNKGYSEFLDLTNVAGSTPLSNFANTFNGEFGVINKELIVGPYGNLWSFFFGTNSGALGETSAFLCILAFIYLSARKVINWYVPTIYVGTVFVITLLIGFFNGYGLWFPVFNILSGGLLFGAVFMATEPVTTPRNPIAKVIYSFGLGVLTVLLRLVGSLPEGVGTSILFMCLFTPLLDRFASKLRANRANWKTIVTLVVIILLIFGIGGYTVLKCKSIEDNRPDEIVKPIYEYEVESVEQDSKDLEKLNVTITKDTNKYNAVFKVKDKKVSYVSGLDIEDETKLNEISNEILNNYLFKNGYIESDLNSELVIIIKGHNDLITAKLAYSGNKITSFEILEHNESVPWSDPVKEAMETIPGKLVEAGKDYEKVENIASATVSSTALKNIYGIAYKYVSSKVVIESDDDSKLTIIGQGNNGPIKAALSYDANYNITLFEILEHNESVPWSDPVKEAMETIPGKLVEAGKNYESVENIASATVSTNALKNIYGAAYNYLNEKTVIVSDENNELIITTRGHNALIKAKLTYDVNYNITLFEILEHNESVPWSDPVKEAMETIPGKLVEAGKNYESVENIASATVSSLALKKIYREGYNYLNEKTVIVSDENNELIITTRGHNALIKAKLTYDANYNITLFEILEHNESVPWSDPVKEAMETIPGKLVEAGKNYESVENIASATVSSLALKKIYRAGYNYLNEKTVIVSDENNELIITTRGHNALIKAKLTYDANYNITLFEILEHNESVPWSDPVKETMETIPGKLVEAGKNYESVENIASATVSSLALKKIYRTAYNYLTGGNE